MPGRLNVAKADHKFAASNQSRRIQFIVVAGVLQLAFLIIFGIFVRYDSAADAKYIGDPDVVAKKRGVSGSSTLGPPVKDDLASYYSMFQDIHVMMFVGFGFLMTFLKRYGFSSVGINMFLACIVIQWSTIVRGCFHLHDGKITFGVMDLLYSDFSCVGILISYGCVLGKLTPVQMMIMAMIQVPIFVGNEYLGLEIFMVKDVGGSIFLHIFGAYFGLFVSLVTFDRNVAGHRSDSTIYHSEIFSMIGTLFLWMFWPSFNSAVALQDSRLRGVINTYITLSSCTVVAFLLSAALTEDRKFLMMHIQNSTIAGGVAVGSVADMQLQPWGAMLIGVVAAIVSVTGYRFLTPKLEKIRFHDTCGVNNLHGMPGLISGIASAIACAVASREMYGDSLFVVFPAMAPANTTVTVSLLNGDHEIKTGLGRTPGTQGLYQLAAIGCTLAVAIVGGTLTGLILRLPFFDSYDRVTYYSDEPHWHRPEDGFPDRFTQLIYHKGETQVVPEHRVDDVTLRGATYEVKVNQAYELQEAN
ncbi:hypothetical protein BOX15_Mlig021874g1 [Macrostomum lignano]|uniref:Ammonium transporter AmtB-like domain-containing protein n=1 Tax=Macrostomum lignano TaxID=282301 RepID=A0A267FEW7_9PLAT|nr:hypothetical protein BOX15_Mlig021874g1 [Macrostomum lignano]